MHRLQLITRAAEALGRAQAETAALRICSPSANAQGERPHRARAVGARQDQQGAAALARRLAAAPRV
jgi:hypothetical protein